MSLPIIHRYLIKDVLLNFLAILIVLLLILLGGVFVRLLSKVVDGTIEASLLFPMMFWGAVESFTTLLVISLFLGMLLSLGRLYKDSEIYALRAIGLGDLQLLLPYLQVTVGVALVLLFLVIWGGPWAKQHVYELRFIAAQKFDLAAITPGQFVRVPNSDDVIFAQASDTKTGALHEIYLFQSQPSLQRIITAQSGRQVTPRDSTERFLEFQNGFIHEIDSSGKRWVEGRFEKSGVYIPGLLQSLLPHKASMLPFTELFASADPQKQAELQWRLSFPISLIVLTILAIPLSYTSPRKGRFGKLAIAILVYLTYSNLLGLSKSWIESGKLPAMLGLWWVHALVLALAFYLLFKQGQILTPRRVKHRQTVESGQ